MTPTRVAWAGAGLVSVALGFVGVLVPGWPTTVFFIVAAWSFSHSSPRLEQWVLDLPRIGPLVRDHRAGLGMPAKAKLFAIASIVVFSSVALVVLDNRWAQAAVAAAALTGVVVVARQPTRADRPG